MLAAAYHIKLDLDLVCLYNASIQGKTNINLQVPGDLGRYRGDDDDWPDPVDDRFFSSDPYAAKSSRDRHSSAMYSILRATFYLHWLSWILEAVDKVWCMR